MGLIARTMGKFVRFKQLKLSNFDKLHQQIILIIFTGFSTLKSIPHSFYMAHYMRTIRVISFSYNLISKMIKNKIGLAL